MKEVSEKELFETLPVHKAVAASTLVYPWFTLLTALTLCRQGVLNIPLLILMNRIFGLYGMIWTQLVVEMIMIPATLGMYMATWKELKGKECTTE